MKAYFFDWINTLGGRTQTRNGSEYWLYYDSTKLIEKLRDNYKLAIVSNMYKSNARILRERFPQFINKFNIVTFSGEIGAAKPGHQIFLYTLEKLNKSCSVDIKSYDVIMIGDRNQMDILPALELGMNARVIDRDNGDKLEDMI